MFKGSFVALITPFKNGKVDEKAFKRLVEWQIAEGTHGLVPCGTTGESPTLSHAEHMRVVELCVEVAAGRVPVLAGTGSNSTAEAIELTKHAKQAGVDGALVVTPYYNKPTQAGLYAHYKAIHDAVKLPIVIYNIPGRCVIDMSVETMGELSKLPRIVGVKDAANDITRPLRQRAASGEKFAMLSGDDVNAVAFNAHGGTGCISVTGNIAPKLCAKLQEATLEGDFKTALAIYQKLLLLDINLFVESNPVPVKYAASLLGLCEPDVRLPLVEMSDASKKKVREAMTAAGLKVSKGKKK